MTSHQYHRRLAQPGSPLLAILPLAAAIVVILALAMSGVSHSAIGPGGQPAIPTPAPEIAPVLALPVHVG